VPYGLPTDQRPDEVYALNYTTPPLDSPLEIIGFPTATLHVSSTAPVMAFVARLCDVAPDGKSALVCNGVLNATRRASLTHPQPLTPGEIYELAIELDCTAWRFEAGHRIRLSVTSADFPNLWPTPYHGQNALYRGGTYPSRLVLPTAPVKPMTDEAEFVTPPGAIDIYRQSPETPAWEIVHDMLGDRTGLKMRRYGVASAGPTIQVVNDFELEVWASNRDPGAVIATGKHRRRIARTDGVTTVDTCAALRSTQTAFNLTIDLAITVNGMLHHTRRWVQTFPRVLL
jgi:hypothetical protein